MSDRVKCPLCNKGVELEEDLEQGDTMFCPGCFGELKIVSLKPPQVEPGVDFPYDEDYEENEEEEDDDYRRKPKEEDW